MRIILLGPPGSGKASISQKIADKYKVSVVNFKNIAEGLSAAAKREDDLGRLARGAISSGRVPDEVCNAVLKEVLTDKEMQSGFVLVGYPTDSSQADEIDTAMQTTDCSIDLVLMIDIDRDELMERRVGRIDCDTCGAKYNLYVNPPMVEGVCDMCGSRVSRRPRGYEENIANQLRDYDLQVAPLLEYYKLVGKLRHADANGTEQELWVDVQRIIDETPPAESRAAAPEVVKKDKAEAALKEDTGEQPEQEKKAVPAKKKATKKVAAKKTAAKTTKKKAKKKPVAKKKPAAKKKVVAKKATKKSCICKSTLWV